MHETQEFAENKEDRCPVVLVLDSSLSMSENGKINDLNDGIIQFRDEILRDPIAALRIEIGLVSFGGIVKVDDQFQSALDFSPTSFIANGSTPPGEAVHASLDLIEKRKTVYRSQGVNYFRPWLWLISDGQPTDEWSKAASKTRQAEADRRITVFPIGIGDDANMDVLEKFSGTRPPMRLKPGHFQEMFKWLSASLARVSKQKAGHQVRLPPTDGWGTTIA
jgi:uncharacterized protein YegL